MGASTDPVGAVSALQAVLRAEHAAVYGYGLVGAHCVGSRTRTATAEWNRHRNQRDQVRRMLRGRGATPAPAQAAYRTPFRVDGPRTAAALAAHLEDGVAAAYLGLVAVASTELRSFAADRLGDSAIHAAWWRGGKTAPFPGMPAGALTRSPEP